ncbi:hypothetical protein PF010_g18157 [Phytophthora fragariae]|uniref:Uncharacterized protein n=1 Tax=Phytophthora fragariae TaxID=53985 RepID=A0A6G0KLV9_9STRA|nr:hypothetical protein PF010_g18157 [Phytophthora fragariae]KAE9197685.1 hypothetical protein PF004_g19759 [Phytophthora fragariae]
MASTGRTLAKNHASARAPRAHMTDEDVNHVLEDARVFLYPPTHAQAGLPDITRLVKLHNCSRGTIVRILDGHPRVGSGRPPFPEHAPAAIAQRMRALPRGLSGRQQAARLGMSASTLARRRASVEAELAKDSTVSFKKANPATRIEFMRHLLRENVMEMSLAYYAITDEAVIDALV